MESKTPNKINFWKCTRDVLIANGKYSPFFIWGICLILLIMKMPGADAAYLASKLVDQIASKSAAIFIIMVVILLAINTLEGYHISFLRKELDRVTKERNALQERMLGGIIESSR